LSPETSIGKPVDWVEAVMEMLPEGLECNMDQKCNMSKTEKRFQHGKNPCGRIARLYEEPASKDVMDCDEHAP
jgi:hypothetical protein